MQPLRATVTRIVTPSFAIARALIVAGMIGSCASSRDDGGAGAPGRDLRPPAIAEPVAPNHCRMNGTILEVRAPVATAASNDPCSKFPCAAKVRVDSVLGYGSAFPGALASGQEIEVRFLYTLGPSREAFPAETTSLPGLGPGERFSADLLAFEELAESGAENRGRQFAIALYTKLL